MAVAARQDAFEDDPTKKKAANDAAFLRERRAKADRTDLLKGADPQSRVRNISVEKTTSDAPKRFSTTTDEQFLGAYAEQGIQPTNLSDRAAANDSVVRSPQVAYRAAPPAPRPQKVRVNLKNKPSHAAVMAARIRASAANIWIFSVGFFSWGFFQIPFWILHVAFLGLSALLDSIAGLAKDTDSGFLLKVAGHTYSAFETAIGAAITAIDEIFGIDLSFFNPQNFFLATWLLFIGYALLIILGMWAAYKLAGLHPLSGRKAGFKLSACLLTFVGYTIPILNFFPWFIVWAFAVWRYPK